MLLAYNDIEIPDQWKHNPSLTNEYDNTVALILANNGIISPKEWYHYPTR